MIMNLYSQVWLWLSMIIFGVLSGGRIDMLMTQSIVSLRQNGVGIGVIKTGTILPKGHR